LVAWHLRRVFLAGRRDELISESDLILGFGVSFNAYGTTKRSAS
jgi:hypothetical protein